MVNLRRGSQIVNKMSALREVMQVERHEMGRLIRKSILHGISLDEEIELSKKIQNLQSMCDKRQQLYDEFDAWRELYDEDESIV